SFTIQMQLPSKEISTTLTLFNMQGTKLWQQDAGKTGGTVYSTVSLENKLTAGVYILVVQRADARLVQKIIISK
ncbi:MAG TPA: T9SS type A sorting domain-containing protein, partial [Panacibacter sp.]|nr:T9SS type A sorting domain-containing protein [Panacibacter sp.]